MSCNSFPSDSSESIQASVIKRTCSLSPRLFSLLFPSFWQCDFNSPLPSPVLCRKQSRSCIFETWSCQTHREERVRRRGRGGGNTPSSSSFFLKLLLFLLLAGIMALKRGRGRGREKKKKQGGGRRERGPTTTTTTTTPNILSLSLSSPKFGFSLGPSFVFLFLRSSVRPSFSPLTSSLLLRWTFCLCFFHCSSCSSNMREGEGEKGEKYYIGTSRCHFLTDGKKWNLFKTSSCKSAWGTKECDWGSSKQ